MVTNSTPNTQAKKKHAREEEYHRQKQPCTWCGESLNTAPRFFGHARAVCQAKQKENQLKGKSEGTK